MYFVGLDLAWSPRNNSAIAVARLKGRKGAELCLWNDKMSSDREIMNYVRQAVGKGDCLIAIDAPLLVPNMTGRRQAEDILQRLFMKHHAAAYPANRTRLGSYGGLRGETLVREMGKIGIRHDPYIKPKSKLRRVIEVFPHPAIVSIFDLDKILKYKHSGRDFEKRCKEFKRFQRLLASLDNFEPSLKIPDTLLGVDVSRMRGKKLKQYEDFLDSVMCAYTALYYWYWGGEKCAVIGDMKGGYIVTPIKRDMKRQIRDLTF